MVHSSCPRMSVASLPYSPEGGMSPPSVVLGVVEQGSGQPEPKVLCDARARVPIRCVAGGLCLPLSCVVCALCHAGRSEVSSVSPVSVSRLGGCPGGMQ